MRKMAVFATILQGFVMIGKVLRAKKKTTKQNHLFLLDVKEAMLVYVHFNVIG